MAGIERQIGVPTEKAVQLRSLIRESIRSERADALLLSGGIDSGALAVLEPTIPAYTVSIAGLKTSNLDISFAGKVQQHLGIALHPVIVSREQALESLRPLIRITQSYDFALLNDLALFIAINKIKEDFSPALKYITVRSGEPADVLFRGYFGTDRLTANDQARYIDSTEASNLPLARIAPHLGVRINYPYLDPRVKEFAKRLAPEENIVYRSIPGGVWDTHPDNPFRKGPPFPFGKVILRQAMFGLLPEEVVMRIKTDIEFGSGTDVLRTDLKNAVTPKEYRQLKRDGLDFWNRSHAGIYKIYREEGIKPKAPLANQTECARCHGAVDKGTSHCNTCGADPSNMTFKEWEKMIRSKTITVGYQNQ